MTTEVEPLVEDTPPTQISDLQIKDRLTGTVTRTEIFGAFIDVGVGKDGLLHVSQLGPGVSRVQDAIKVGDSVTVWVRKVETDTGRIDLTMTEPLGLEWSEIRKGMTVKGTVVRLENFGAFVDIKGERPALLHVREMSTGYVSHPKDVVNIGDEIEARVLNVDRRRKKIDLSIKAIEEEEKATALQADDDEDEELLSPMALALQAAMSAKEKEGGKRRRQKRKKSYDREEDDLYTRTLQSQSKD